MTSRLGRLAVDHWEDINGYAVAHNMPDLRGMTLTAFLDFIWYIMTRNAEPAQVEKFRRMLWMPPKGTAPDKRSPWSKENETAAFKAFKTATTGAS